MLFPSGLVSILIFVVLCHKKAPIPLFMLVQRMSAPIFLGEPVSSNHYFRNTKDLKNFTTLSISFFIIIKSKATTRADTTRKLTNEE